MKGKRFKRATALLSTAAMLLTCADLSAMDLSVHAEGTPEYVAFDVNGDGVTEYGELAYKLVSAEDLYWFANKVNSGDEFLAAFLANDITVNSAVLDENGKLNEGDSFKNWTPVGNDSNIYSGIFNGAGHTISGLYFNDSGTDYVGLFGYVSSGGEIRNVTVADSYFCGRYYVGGACGQNYGLFENCCNAGAVTGNTIVGGVCGDNCGTIKKCYNTGDVEGNRIGGICGMNTNTLENCYNKGAVKGNNSGGICGTNQSTISNCYYLADSDDGNGGKTENQFRSGEVCWLLNGEKAEAPVFFQTLGTDESPVLDSTHNTVYKNKACDGVSDYYNSENKDQEHAYENGICTICDGYEPATDSDSDGVYEISNAGQLYWFTNEVNIDNDNYGDANAVLTKDITVNSGVLDENGELNSDTSNFRAWINYGSQYYQGTFDGAGYTISGLYFNDSDTTYVGLFGLNLGTIKNVSVTDSYFCGKGYVGGVCGYNKGIIENCSNTGTAESNCYAGGICGYNGCTIKNCSNTGAVEGSESAGGICGDNAKDGTIEYCYNIGDATAIGENAYAGGVCGYNNGTIENCYYLDTVAEDSYATAMSETAFASGEVCWLLNGEKGESPAFFQNLGTDNFPVLDNTHNTVYKNKACNGVSDHYNHENKNQEHAYENGICTICDGYEPAKAVADVTDIDGDGDRKENVYEISNAGQLYWFAGLVNGTLKGVEQNKSANAVLTNDITVTSGVLDEDGELNEGDFRAWTPIGNISSKYSGTFDGAGYTISGLYFNDSGADYVGLFGANSKTIKNVIVADSYFYGNSKVGGICGSNSNKNGKIENCYNTAKVSGSTNVGGVCGFNYQATISNCFNTGNISAEEYVGGVCGYNQNKSTILNCYNTGKVSGSEYVGGISGENSDINLITNCYNTGKVEGSTDVGGICGNNCIDCEVTNCYYLEVDGLNGINGNTTSAEVTAKNETDFASGEVCWLLNGGETQAESPAFFQTLGEDDFPVLDSTHKTVYLTSPCIAYTNTEGETAEHCFKDEICEKCGAFKDGIGARLAGVSLSLDGSIGVNFYMQLADEVLEDETAYMQFTLPNGGILTIKVSEAETKTIDGVTYYGFQCNVAATEMRDTIKAQIITANGNGTEYSYTVKEYADYLLAHTGDNDEYAKAEKLVKAMLTYGAYAQIFKGHNTDTLQSEQLSDVSDYVIDEHGYTVFPGNTVKFAGANLSMLSNTTLRLFFTADDMNGVTFMRGADQLEVRENNGLYFVEITNISPNKLDQDITVTVDDNGKEFFVTYSPMTYCYLVSQRSDDTALVNLVKAIAKYWYVAKECFEEAQ